MDESSNSYRIFYEGYLDTNACTECTGLIPNLAENEAQWNSYRDIFDFEAVPEKASSPSGSRKTQTP